MERRHARAAATILAIVVCSVGAGSAAARPALAPGWTTHRPARLPVSLALPTTWAVQPPPSGARFYALSGPDAYVELALNAYDGKASEFVASESASVRSAYRKQDPKAVLRSRTVALPAGKAFEVIARLTVKKTGAPSQALSIYDYSFLHRGRIYEFLYAVVTDKVAAYLPIFNESVRSIRFTS